MKQIKCTLTILIMSLLIFAINQSFATSSQIKSVNSSIKKSNTNTVKKHNSFNKNIKDHPMLRVSSFRKHTDTTGVATASGSTSSERSSVDVDLGDDIPL